MRSAMSIPPCCQGSHSRLPVKPAISPQQEILDSLQSGYNFAQKDGWRQVILGMITNSGGTISRLQSRSAKAQEAVPEAVQPLLYFVCSWPTFVEV